MNKVGKRVVLVVAAVALLAASFWAGTRYVRTTVAARGLTAAGAPGAGGRFGDLTDAERQKLQNMTDEERRNFMQDRAGDSAANGRPGGVRGGSPTLEGSVVEVSGKTVTLKLASGGSSTIYLTADTVLAYAKGVAEKELTTGDDVIAIATPATDNVMNASTVVVK